MLSLVCGRCNGDIAMLWVTLVCLGFWVMYRRTREISWGYIVVISVIASGIVVLITNPTLSYDIDENQTLSIYSPTTYPFTVQQSHDWSTSEISVRVVLGWPDGFLLLVSESIPYQSEYIILSVFETVVGVAIVGLLLQIPIFLTLEAVANRKSKVDTLH